MSVILSAWLLAALMAPAIGALGCFLVWRRMAFFAESLAHASILGLACAFAFHINVFLGMLASGLVVCFLLLSMRNNKEMPNDAWLNIIAHVMMGGGLVIAYSADLDIDLEHYFLGDWLEVAPNDLLIEGGAMLLVMAGLFIIRKPLLASTAQEDIAIAEQSSSNAAGDWRVGWRGNFIFLALLTLFVGVSLTTLGLLLINTLMIIPALTVRHWSTTPYGMIGGSILVSLLIMSGGLGMAIMYDIPASASAAVFGGFLFFLSWLLKQFLSDSLKS